MKFKEYVESLNEVLKQHPESAEYEAVYSADDEGNSYQQVGYAGSLGHFEGGYRGDWTPTEYLNKEDMGDEDFDPSEYPINSVCVN